MGSRIRDSAAAVHEAAATLGFMLKKEQEKVIVAFTQGHDDVFVALPTGFGKSLCYCCRPYVLTKLTNGSIAVVVSLVKDQVAHCTSIVSLACVSG